MSSQVKVLISMALVAVASGATAGGITVSLTDGQGAAQSSQIRASAYPAPDANGQFSLEVDFSGVSSGSFTGSVQAFDANGANLGDPVSFSGTNTNLQPLPTAVTVAFA